MKATIIGGGVIGCACAFELQRRGFEVTVVERNGAVGHGSTSASCGIVRRFYSQPGMIAMADEGAHIWADWDRHIGPVDGNTINFPRPGMIFFPPKLDDSVLNIVSEMKRLGIKVSVLTADEVIERFPFFDNASHFPSKQPEDEDFFKTSGRRIEGAIFEEDAGYVVSPDLATQNLRLAGEREGVIFRLKCEVRDIKRTHSKAYRLETKDGSIIESQILINAGGPHSSIINRMAGVKLPLETRALRREVHSLRNPLFDEVKGSPVPVIGDLDGGVYSRPEAGGRGITVGSTDPDCDVFDWVEDPDDYLEGVTGKYWERQTLRLMKRIPQLEQGRPRGISALYDVTVKDWYPICDRTDMPGYYVCIGTSGSSFKTSPVLGMMMAEIIEASEKGRDIDHDPIQLKLPRTGVSIDTRFLSRLRGKIETIGTVFG